MPTLRTHFSGTNITNTSRHYQNSHSSLIIELVNLLEILFNFKNIIYEDLLKTKLDLTILISELFRILPFAVSNTQFNAKLIAVGVICNILIINIKLIFFTS